LTAGLRDLARHFKTEPLGYPKTPYNFEPIDTVLDEEGIKAVVSLHMISIVHGKRSVQVDLSTLHKLARQVARIVACFFALISFLH
jgi:hypothetical protein